MDIIDILKKAADDHAADIFIVSGAVLSYKAQGRMVQMGEVALNPDDTRDLVRQLFRLAKFSSDSSQMPERERDFSVSVTGIGRFRVNVYKQRNSFSAVLRYVPFELPDPEALGIPEQVMRLADCKSGIVIVTGVASSGKSTTLSCLTDRINNTRNGHIITIEDPIEFLHKHNKCIVSQREISIDTDSYIDALRAALRQSPDVILLGEMNDHDTISVAMTAAETGQLVLTSMHTIGVANTIARIIDLYPVNQQHQIRVQLSMVLNAVICQQLLPSVDGGLIPAFEIMTVNSEVRSLIRDQRTAQIDDVIRSSDGMQTMDGCILGLYRDGRITAQTALDFAYDPDYMAKQIN